MKRIITVIATFITAAAAAQPKWQQHVDTKIDVSLDDKHNFINAFEELTYTNNSPDTLQFIYMHLWPNAYKNDHTPFAKQLDVNGNTSFYYAKARDRGYIDSLQFTIDGRSVEHYSLEDVPDIARIDLPKPLLPGGKIKIATPFRVKILKVFSRMGHSGQAYYISQWFPKPAVYDPKGWHPISYMDQGEFYSEYGSYDVSITLPANYVLMATGNCMDEKETQWLDEQANKPLPNDTLYNRGTPASAPEMKTVHYHEDNIHDFAWFADKRWIVRKDTVVSPGNNLLVTAWSAFLPSYQKVWKSSNTYLKETVKHYGKWVGPYQYKTIKAVLGDMHAGGGMEYPTVTIIDKSIKSNLKTVIVHEAGHNWFYGMLGSNEREHAWMDEGINTFYEQKTTRALSKDSSKVISIGLDESLLYYEAAATHDDQAIDQVATNFTKINYGLDVYYKTGLVLRWLEQYIGKEDFEAGMKDYFDTWHFHHPYPADMKACLQRHTSKPLDWFFDTILTTDNRIDFTITKARINGGNTDVSIRNNTGINSPAWIKAYDHDSLVGGVWTTPFTNTAKVSLPGTSWTRLKIAEEIPDGKTANNTYRRHALFHHFGMSVKPYFGFNLTSRDKLFISPAPAYNQYDGFMFGFLFHDITVPENRFRFAIAPMYAFGSKAMTGVASVGYVWYPENVFKEVMLQADAKTFHDAETLINLDAPLYASYLKVAPSLTFTFNEHNALSPVTRTLTLTGYHITENNIDFGADSTGKPALKTQENMYGLLQYKHENRRAYNPFGYSIEGQGNADFVKINIEGNVRIDYNVKNKSLYVRGYLGKFFPLSNDASVTSRYELNASYSGVDDYLYDGTYRGRNAYNGYPAHQVSMQEGGFKIPVYNNAGRSDNWMATVNLKTDLPLGKLPIRLFFDAGLIPNADPGRTNTSSSTLLYDGGVEIGLVKDIASIYIPVIMSSDFQNYLTNTFGRKNVFARSISFTLDLHNINWLKTPTKIVKSVVN